MALKSSGHATILKLNSEAEGICYESKPGFSFKYVLPGEEIEYEEHQYRRETNYVLRSILKKSEHRVDPFCRYYTKCGGCSMQHFSASYYTEFKHNLLKDLLKNLEVDINPELIEPSNSKRRRVNIFFSKVNEKFYLGFYRAGTNNIVNIESCEVATPIISEIIKALTPILSSFFNHNFSGELHILNSSNGIAIDIMISENFILSDFVRRKMKSIYNLDSVIEVNLYSSNNLIYNLTREKPFIEISGIKVQVKPRSFLQPLEDSGKIISEIILKNIQGENQKIADLFCGRGTYLIPLSLNGHYVSGYESDMDSIESLKESEFQSSKLYLKNLYQNPLTEDELNNFDVILLNPPRTGAYEQVKNIIKSNAGSVIYVSCSSKTFERDAKILLQKYKLNKLYGIDQFKWTSNIEIIAVFSR